MKTIISLLTTTVLLAVAPAAFGQCDVETNIVDCTINDILSQGGRVASRQAAAAGQKAVANEVTNSNRATTAPDPFAARLHSSYQDFLVPLSFALNDVMESEDGRALILRFNPLREPPFVAGLTVTASKAELDERISAAVPEDKRDETVNRLKDDFEDVDDITLAGSFALESDDCEEDKSFCWGRNPRTYDQLLSDAFLALAVPGLDDPTEADLAINDLRQAARDTGVDVDTPLRDVEQGKRQRLIDLSNAAIAAGQRDSARFIGFLNREGIDQLAALLDNQPQFAFTATLRDRNLTAGPREIAYTFEYQFGFTNLNSVKRGCKTDFADCLGTTLRTAVKIGDDFSDKFVLSASYKDIDRYHVTAEDLDVTGFTPIDLPRHREVSAKLQWGKRLRTRIADQHPRIDVNAEGIRITDGTMRKKNDWIGTATLTIPLMKNMSIPLSLKYGNRRELLGEVDDELSAHFGISYRLPWEMQTP